MSLDLLRIAVCEREESKRYGFIQILADPTSAPIRSVADLIKRLGFGR